MNYKVLFETRAKKEFLALPPEAQLRLETVFDDMAKNPRPPGAKKLTGQAGYRIRKGDYRILYTINDAAKTFYIYRVGHRRNVYR